MTRKIVIGAVIAGIVALAVALFVSPFLAALALEAGIFLLRRHQGSLLGAVTARH